jgi:hypothetical protein
LEKNIFEKVNFTIIRNFGNQRKQLIRHSQFTYSSLIMEHLYKIISILGTVAFSISGAYAGIQKDWIGLGLLW